MSADHHPRYVTTTDGLWVLDRWYCHREVYRADAYDHGHHGGRRGEDERRADTRQALDRLNAEHDAWLAAG